MAKTTKDHLETLHDYGIHVPTRTIFLETSLDESGGEDGVNYFMAMRFFKNLYLLENSAKELPITIISNTNGGDVEQGMAIYDAIVASKCHITLKVMGNASSMGCWILQAGDDRVLTPHSSVMFHHGTPGHAGNNAHEVFQAAKYELEFRERMDKVLYDRIKTKMDKDNKPFSLHKFNDLNMKGRYMSAQEAVEIGLADRIE